MLEQWDTLVAASTKIYNKLSADYRPAFFELVHHPVQASATLGKMWIYAGMNNLRASQARLSTNDYAVLVEDLFEEDYKLETQYHSLLDGKWDHMMDQTHVMYYYWQVSFSCRLSSLVFSTEDVCSNRWQTPCP